MKYFCGAFLEWGPPRAVLTDNRLEFGNVLLKELCRLWRVRLCDTPPLHPQSNYTERANKYIGETLMNLVNAPCARRRDWPDYVKYIEFVYNRKYIPGTNLSPYMVTVGRQPLTPIDTAYMDSEGLAVATAPHAPLEEHSKQLVAKLKMADEAVDVARVKTLDKSREQFNQSRIDKKILPGEMVRYFRRLTARRGDADADSNEVKLNEISKLKLRNEPYRVTRQLTPTTYQLEHPETGKPKPRPAHISQIARLKVPQQPRAAEDETGKLLPDDMAPIGEQDIWGKLGSPGHTISRFCDDEVHWLRVAEVLAVDLENGTAELWYYLRSRQHSTKKWHAPLVLSPHHPEYYDERSPGTSHLKPKTDKIPHLRRRQAQVGKTDVEFVVPYLLLEITGKVPRKVCAAADEYLRRQYKAGADIAPVALAFLTEGEEQFQKQLSASLRRSGGGN